MRAKMLRRVAATWGAGLFMLATALPAAAQTTIAILVRHAEQERDGSRDPDLTAAGRARADSLAAMVRRAGVSAIYHTTLKRTTQTAEPAARALNLTSTPLGLRPGQSIPEHAEEVASTILTKHAGQVVLVVGHSNTVPAIAAALGVSDPPAIEDTDFSQVLIVIRAPDQPPRLIHTRYGG